MAVRFLTCLLLGTGTYGLLPNQFGVLSPRPLFLEAHRAFRVRCEVNSSLNIDHLYFKLDDNRVNDSLVDQHTRWEAVLSHSGLPLEPSLPWLCCHAVMETGSDLEVTCHHYYVDVKAYKPTITSVELDNWDCVKVTWSKQPNKNMPTAVDVEIRLPLESQFRTCPPWLSNSCRYCGEFYMDSYNVTVRVLASNDFGNASDEVTNRLADIVRVREVQNITATTANSFLHISWRSPREGWDIRYLVKSACPFKEQPEIFELKTSANQPSHDTSDPWPYCLYTVSVMACPILGQGHCSQQKDVSVRAKAAVPARLPAVTTGGFHIDEAGLGDMSRDQQVTIYWQPVPEKYQNGGNFSYIIKTCVNDTICDTIRDIAPKTFSHTFRMSSSFEHKIYINVQNEMGVLRSSVPHGITVPVDGESPTLPRNVTALAESERKIRLSWAGDDVTDNNFVTVYHCAGNTAQDECQKHLWWTTVPSDVSSVLINVPEEISVYHYRFGISRQIGNLSTGIHWIHCLYDLLKPAPVPSAWLVGTAKTEAIVGWKDPPCGAANGFTAFHRIRWQPLEEKGPADEMEASPAQNEIVIPNLAPGEKYQIDIFAVNSAGPSAPVSLEAATKQGPHMGYVAFVIPGVVVLALIVFGAYILARNTLKAGRRIIGAVPVDGELVRQSGLRWQEARVSIGEYTNIHPDYVPEQIGNAGQVEEVEQDDVGDIHPNSLPGQIGNVDQVEEDEEDDDGDVNPCSVPGQISNVGQVEEDEEDDDDDSTNSDNGSSSADSNRSSTHSENTVYYPEASVSLLSDSGDTVYYGGAVV